MPNPPTTALGGLPMLVQSSLQYAITAIMPSTRQGGDAYLRSHTRATLYYKLIDQLPDVYVVSHNPITNICTDTMIVILYVLLNLHDIRLL